ncbi:MAG: inosine/xanthosine triphosphatase [Patescibacteria group bacterium]
MKIFVGSTNPVKINAVITAASETWPEIQAEGFSVPSDVDDQPRSDEETEKGAVNRARGALKLGIKKHQYPISNIQTIPNSKLQISKNNDKRLPTSDEMILGVGLEGGVFTKGDELWSTVWVAVIDREGDVFTANGARCKVPEPIAKLIKKGEEMGPAVDSLLTGESVRQKEGMIGVITKGFVDRTEEYAAIAKFALGLWYGRHWHDTLSK